jgi:hypothetical protein
MVGRRAVAVGAAGCGRAADAIGAAIAHRAVARIRAKSTPDTGNAGAAKAGATLKVGAAEGRRIATAELAAVTRRAVGIDGAG